MESMLKKVNELEGMLLKALVESDNVAKENEVMAKENKELRATLNKKAKDLTARELVVKPIEDVAEYRAKADQVMRDANKKMKVALAEQDTADKKKAENAKEHGEQKARIAREDKRVLDDKAGLKKGYDQLKKAKDNAEHEVVTAIAGKIKKG